MRKLKLVFVGGSINSAIGRTHEIAIKMDNLFELVGGFFSLSNEINKLTAHKLNVKSYDNFEDLLEDRVCYDAIVILSPTNTHFQYIKQALKYNIPIISEKSLVSSYDEVIELNKIVKKNSSFLLTTYNYTGYPMVREIKYMIENNLLGTISYIKIQMPQESFIKLDKNNQIPKIQEWRLKDYKISTISLDLGTHLTNLIEFLIHAEPIEVVAMSNSFGHFNVTDYIEGIIKYNNNINCNIFYSKSALGYKNGLQIEIYGDKASVKWEQINPEFIVFNDNKGNSYKLDRSSSLIHIAKEERYNRFKSGHPAGFIEAFANHYMDIYFALNGYLDGKKNYLNKYVFNIDYSIKSLFLINIIEKSAKKHKWINIKQHKDIT